MRRKLCIVAFGERHVGQTCQAQHHPQEQSLQLEVELDQARVQPLNIDSELTLNNFKPVVLDSGFFCAMSEQERPRARAAQEGLGALNDRELIALLLGTGHKGRSAELLAQEVLELAQGCLNNLASWPVESLTVVNGIGPAKATLVAAAMELGRRREGTIGGPGRGSRPAKTFGTDLCLAWGTCNTRSFGCCS